MFKCLLPIAFVAMLSACTAAQVAQTETDVTVACSLAPLVASADQDELTSGCQAATALEPVVAPLLTK